MVKLRGRSMSYASSLARKRYRARGGGYLAPSATNARVPSSFQNVKRRNRKYNKVCISYRPTCPAQMIVPMKYVSEVLSRTCTVGASTYYLWNFNDIYDPDRTGTGHQPLGHDQWVLFYGVYRVLSASIKIWAVNTTDATPFRIVLNTMGSTSGEPDADAAQENQGVEKFGGDQTKVVRLGMKRKGHEVFNVTKEVYRTDDLYRGLTNASPGKVGCFQVWFQPFDESTTQTFKFKAEIQYNVLFSNPRALAQS